MKLAVFGYGMMAEAIISAIKDDYEIEVVGRDEEKLKNFASKYGLKYALIDGYDITGKIVLLAIKPYALQEVSMRIKGEADVLISVLAGKPIIELERIKAKAYIRAMPNIAAKYKASTTALCGDESAKEIALEIFNKIGESIWVNSDDEIDMATAIIGSAPAFLALIAESIEDGGVYNGLKRELSHKLTKGLFKSFAALSEDFGEIKKSVMSPKGTTAEGVRSLEKDGAKSAFFEAVVKTYEKAKRI
ncbi:MAG: pyrroline-5-carboxylate reductase [Epsilonproteobacteria bacterium]|nr:pyrroline-5-carboxylate reductase [Campylobacterota bacterium]